MRRPSERSALHHGRLADSEPYAFLEIAHDPLAIDHLEEKPPAGVEHRRGDAHHATIVRLIVEVDEAGKEGENQIEVLAGSRLAHTALEPAHLDAACVSTRPGHPQ